MKVFNCHNVTAEMIVLKEKESVIALYKHIKESKEDFVLEWEEKGMFKSKPIKKSKVIIHSMIKEPVLSGEIRISSSN